MGGGWVYLYSFICLSAGVVEWQPYYFAITLLRHAPPKVASVLVLFVIFVGLFLVRCIGKSSSCNRLSLAALVAYSLWLFILLCCIESTVNELEVVDCTLESTFHNSSYLFWVTELTFLFRKETNCFFKLL